MKIRNFYPKQVAKRIARKGQATYTPGERAALNYFLRNIHQIMND